LIRSAPIDKGGFFGFALLGHPAKSNRGLSR